MQATKKKSRLKNGWNLTHLTQHPCNLLIESDLRLRQVAVGRWCKVTHLAHRYRDGGGTPPPTGYPGTSPAFRGAEAAGRGGGFFACKVCRYEGARVPYTPFGDPYPHRLATYGHRPTPPYWPPTPPHLLDGHPLAKGGLATYGLRGAGFFPHLPPLPLWSGRSGEKISPTPQMGVGGSALRPKRYFPYVEKSGKFSTIGETGSYHANLSV